MTDIEINDDILQDYTNAICRHSRIGADAVKTLLSNSERPAYPRQEIGAIQYAEILLEFVTLLLSFTDRCLFWVAIADKRLGVRFRDDLMDELVGRCISSAVDYCFFGLEEHPKEEYKKSCFRAHNARMEQYAKYEKCFAEKGEGTKDTLVWEFAKNVCEMVGRDHDIALLTMCAKVIVNAIKDVDSNSFIAKLLQ